MNTRNYADYLMAIFFAGLFFFAVGSFVAYQCAAGLGFRDEVALTVKNDLSRSSREDGKPATSGDSKEVTQPEARPAETTTTTTSSLGWPRAFVFVATLFIAMLVPLGLGWMMIHRMDL